MEGENLLAVEAPRSRCTSAPVESSSSDFLCNIAVSRSPPSAYYSTPSSPRTESVACPRHMDGPLVPGTGLAHAPRDDSTRPISRVILCASSIGAAILVVKRSRGIAKTINGRAIARRRSGRRATSTLARRADRAVRGLRARHPVGRGMFNLGVERQVLTPFDQIRPQARPRRCRRVSIGRWRASLRAHLAARLRPVHPFRQCAPASTCSRISSNRCSRSCAATAHAS